MIDYINSVYILPYDGQKQRECGYIWRRMRHHRNINIVEDVNVDEIEFTTTILFSWSAQNS